MRNKYLKNVATLELLSNNCIGCKKCVLVCPHRVLAFNNKKANIQDKDKCIECGACEKNCPTRAITVNASVGCASAIIKGWLTGSKPSCDCLDDGGCC